MEELRLRFRMLDNPHVLAVLLFGSTARGEACERSDLDLLILHDGCISDDPVDRRRELYLLAMKLIGDLSESVTIVDMELESFVNPGEVTPLLLNIYWDAIVIYDRTGLLERFLESVRARIAESGLKRVRDGRAYYWILPAPMRGVKII